MASPRKSRRLANSSPASPEQSPKQALFLSLAGETISRIAWFLEPEPDTSIHEVFNPLTGEYWSPYLFRPGRRTDRESDHDRQDYNRVFSHAEWPNLDRLRSGKLPAWEAYKNLRNLALTCRHIGDHVHPFRVCIVYTGVQVARLFAWLILNPDRRRQIETLQLHPCLFGVYHVDEEARLKWALGFLKWSTDFDMLAIAHDICDMAGHRVAPNKPLSAHIALSTALTHILSAVNRLFLPYPRNAFPKHCQMRSLDFSPAVLPAAAELPQEPLARKALQAPIEVTFSAPRPKHLTVKAMAHYQKWEIILPDVIERPKQPDPLSYWAAICSNPNFQNLRTLALESIGDPLSLNGATADLCLPFLRVLRLRSMNIDEEGLVRMPVATPILEELDVIFTFRSARSLDDSIRKQQLLDRSFPGFPQTLKTLTLLYFKDPTFDGDTLMGPRERLFNLDKLGNVESLGIEITSLVTTGDNIRLSWRPNFGPLPPKLRQLRVYSGQAGTEMGHAPGMLGREVSAAYDEDMGHLEWDFILYKRHLDKFALGLEGRLGSRELASVILMPPLAFCENVYHAEKNRHEVDSPANHALRLVFQHRRVVDKLLEIIPQEMERIGAEIERKCGIRVEVDVGTLAQAKREHVRHRPPWALEV